MSVAGGGAVLVARSVGRGRPPPPPPSREHKSGAGTTQLSRQATSRHEQNLRAAAAGGRGRLGPHSALLHRQTDHLQGGGHHLLDQGTLPQALPRLAPAGTVVQDCW